MFKNAKEGDARLMDMILNRIDGKVPDVLVGGLGFGALEDVPSDILDKIIDAGNKAKGAQGGE